MSFVTRCTLLLTFATAGCSRPSPQADGPALLQAAHRALGVTDSISTILAAATVESPGGGFEARIASAVNGNVRLTLGKLIAGVHQGRSWSCDPAGQVTTMDSVTRSVVRGHDLHMLVIAPSWMAPPVRDRDRRWNADSVMSIRFTDELGAPLLLHLRVTDTLPIGLDVVNHSGSGPREVRVIFDDWQDVGGVLLFRGAVFEHGGNRFIYRYHELAINTLADTVFQPGC